MESKALIFGCLFALVVLLAPAPVPAYAQGAPGATLDDALLLMLASQSHLYEVDELADAGVRVPGLAEPVSVVDSQGVTPAQINERAVLAQMYSRFANAASSDPADPLRQSFEQRADQHRQAAERLAAQRQRDYRRGKGFQLFMRRRVLQPAGKGLAAVGKGVGWVARGVGKAGRIAFIIAKDEVIFRAKQIIRAKLQEVRNLLQGRIDAVWARIATKLGMPLTELIRQVVVDPAFVRLRDQVAGRLGVQRAGESSSGGNIPASEDDGFDTDWSNVGPEGETGYDEETDDEGIPTPTLPPTVTPTPTLTPTPTSTPTPEPTDTPAPPTLTPTITPTPGPTDFGGSWNSGIPCAEAEDAPYTWGLTLSQPVAENVTGTLYYHACPDGGRAYYNVTGTATSASSLTLHARLTGSRGPLADTALSSMTLRFTPPSSLELVP